MTLSIETISLIAPRLNGDILEYNECHNADCHYADCRGTQNLNLTNKFPYLASVESQCGRVSRFLAISSLDHCLMASPAVSSTRECYCRGRLSTIDLHNKIRCFIKKEKYRSYIKSSWSGLVGTRWSTVLILPFH
jgi:hypothetical protein